jgi:hypothetical protein
MAKSAGFDKPGFIGLSQLICIWSEFPKAKQLSNFKANLT